MDLIHEMGGLTYVPHPLDRHRAHFSPERIVELADRIDIIETYNPWCEPAANQAAARAGRGPGQGHRRRDPTRTAASELGRSWMEIEDLHDARRTSWRSLRSARHVVTASSGTGRRA